MKNRRLILAAAAAALLACPGPLVRPVPPPCKSGLVAVLIPNPFPGAAQRCPILATTIEVSEGKVQRRAGVTASGLAPYLPSNPVDPKSGCYDKICPRMTLSLTTESLVQPASDDGGSTTIDPCSGNPMMEGPVGSGGFSTLINDAQMIRLAQDADRAREASLSRGATSLAPGSP